MVQDLAEELGVATESIETLGVGYYPGDACWIFAERDATGDIIGLAKRPHKGIKHMITGSKRGLIYAYNPDHEVGDKRYDAGKCQWINIQDQANLVCPICGRERWCMVSPDNPEDPSAVICNRISQGSIREMPGGGYLHIRKQQQGKGGSMLPPTELPILSVEGASDVLAAMSMGFVAIGRPSAPGGMAILKEMPLTGKEVWVIGERDIAYKPDGPDGTDGTPFYPGREGMEKAAVSVKTITDTVTSILPPEGVKDLRQWVQRGLTLDSLYKEIGERGDDNRNLDPNIFPDKQPSTVAKRFKDTQHTTQFRDKDGILHDVVTLRKHHKRWRIWNAGQYEEIEPDIFDGQIRKYTEDKKFVKPTAKGLEVAPYNTDNNGISNIIGALNRWCPVTGDPPMVLDGADLNPNNLMIFKNGMLDVEEYIRTGCTELLPHDPRLFTFNIFPYDFDPDAESELYEKFVDDLFNSDVESIRLLAQWLGYNLVPDMSFEKLMLFMGDRRSGKGTLLNVLRKTLGEGQCVATNYKSLGRQFGCADMVSKLAATIGDTKQPSHTESNAAMEVMLQISGGDCVVIEKKFKDQISAYLKCRFTIATNEIPNFSDPARAFSARANILNFPNSYYGKEDPTLKTRLEKEASEGKLINVALRGLKDLREQGKFIIPGVSEELRRQLEEVTAPVTAFVRHCCTMENPDIYITKAQLYEAWECWCKREHRKVINPSYFGRYLKQACPSVIGERLMFEGKRQQVYKGVDLCQWVYDEYLARPKNTTTEGGA